MSFGLLFLFLVLDARTGYGLRRIGLVTVLGRVDALEHPVRDGQVVHRRREEVVGDRPLGGLAVDLALEGAVPREVLDQRQNPPAGELFAVPVEYVDPVVADEVRLKGLGVFFDELDEAQSSPRPSPVSLP
ncbi:hypothetical protein ACFXGT_04230 [Streptomyces sp. NPDC059352]|uniref:hypothetical protein n=1 Tax=Streptomyces sp. NPDC059352 TaxID=3346810 RepID=UPI0036B923EE